VRATAYDNLRASYATLLCGEVRTRLMFLEEIQEPDFVEFVEGRGGRIEGGRVLFKKEKVR